MRCANFVFDDLTTLLTRADFSGRPRKTHTSRYDRFGRTKK
jgi:hypothetical protein